jgi:hypothetical protein
MLVKLQAEYYPEFDDIKENFLIDFYGTVYATRGFTFEGETSILDETKTSFDAQAISISFMVAGNESKEISAIQFKSFCNFLNDSLINKEIAGNYKLFNLSSLLGNENLIDFPKDCQLELYWEKSN